jgi:hypothetical protein
MTSMTRGQPNVIEEESCCSMTLMLALTPDVRYARYFL